MIRFGLVADRVTSHLLSLAAKISLIMPEIWIDCPTLFGKNPDLAIKRSKLSYDLDQFLAVNRCRSAVDAWNLRKFVGRLVRGRDKPAMWRLVAQSVSNGRVRAAREKLQKRMRHRQKETAAKSCVGFSFKKTCVFGPLRTRTKVI